MSRAFLCCVYRTDVRLFAMGLTNADSPALACLGKAPCIPIFASRGNFSRWRRRGWRHMLGDRQRLLRGDHSRNCISWCNESAMACSADHPAESWDVEGGIDTTADLASSISAALASAAASNNITSCEVSHEAYARGVHARSQCKLPRLLPHQTLQAWNPRRRDVATGFRSYEPKHEDLVLLPCSSSRGEDAAALRTFFSDNETGHALRGGTFLEIGGVEGFLESNTWVLEACLGWQGVLVEAHPSYFKYLRVNRPASLNLRLAACREAHGWVRFNAHKWTGAMILDGTKTGDNKETTPSFQAECGALGATLADRIGVDRLDFVSIDVEGSELLVVESLLDAPNISMGVVFVEVRSDGQRHVIIEQLLKHGMRYVGQFNGRGTTYHNIVDDVFVNLTHLRRYMPRSRALARSWSSERSRWQTSPCPSSWGTHDRRWYSYRGKWGRHG